mmetsp:Transcript_16217/g.48723  ORF Transcript_16217/g.48723 Transcript_16217/m.48723 type:complete len:346 (+) Transcript_16217:1866-2903(+)
MKLPHISILVGNFHLKDGLLGPDPPGPLNRVMNDPTHVPGGSSKRFQRNGHHALSTQTADGLESIRIEQQEMELCETERLGRLDRRRLPTGVACKQTGSTVCCVRFLAGAERLHILQKVHARQHIVIVGLRGVRRLDVTEIDASAGEEGERFGRAVVVGREQREFRSGHTAQQDGIRNFGPMVGENRRERWATNEMMKHSAFFGSALIGGDGGEDQELTGGASTAFEGQSGDGLRIDHIGETMQRRREDHLSTEAGDLSLVDHTLLSADENPPGGGGVIVLLVPGHGRDEDALETSEQLGPRWLGCVRVEVVGLAVGHAHEKVFATRTQKQIVDTMFLLQWTDIF